ncbi:MAG TPA: hypothetical protein GXX57_09435 [Firmicutes bacterium]|nr:hypothetical protein [Bacillota bacterium]
MKAHKVARYLGFVLIVLLLFGAALCQGQEGGELISLGKPATANPGDWSAAQANDGDLATRWATGNDQYPAWWQVDLGGQYALTGIEINWYGEESRAYGYTVAVSSDGIEFEVVLDREDNRTFGPTSEELEVQGRYVRITLTGAYPSGWPSINEVRIYGRPAAQAGLVDLESTWIEAGYQVLNRGKAVKANQEGYPAAHANDGKLDTRWGTIDGSYPAWWQVDLGSKYDLAGVAVNWYNEASRAYQYRIEVSDDGKEFTTVVDRTNNLAFGPTMDALDQRARYVRITITAAVPNGWPSICDVRVYGDPASKEEALTTFSAVTVDCSTVLGSLADFRALYMNNAGLSDRLDIERLQRDFDFRVYRGWMNMSHYYNLEKGTYDFARYYAYLERLSSLSDGIMIVLRGLEPQVEQGLLTMEEYTQILKDGLLHYKEKYPKLKYVEAMNEFDLLRQEITFTRPYYDFYKAFYEAVNYVNRTLQPEEPLLLGGPVASHFGVNYTSDAWERERTLLQEFIRDFAQDPNPEKRLDFLSYHQYLNRNGYRPSLVDREIEMIREYFLAHSLDPDVPIHITELGVLPGDYGTDDYAADLLLQAAGVATLMYRYLEQGLTTTYHWVDHHLENSRKDVLVPNQPGKLTPYGNMMLMQTMLKQNRVAAVASPQTSEGIGVYALASADETGVAIMIWNYDWPDWTWGDGSRYESVGRDFAPVLNVFALPDSFLGKNMRVEHYLIDSTHSNYTYNLQRAELEKVVDKVQPAAGWYTATVPLEKNAIALVVLIPTDEEPRPSVVVSSPEPFTVVQGAVPVRANVDLPLGVRLEQVQIALNGGVIYEGSNVPSDFMMDTAAYADGDYELVVSVRTANGAVVSKTVPVTFHNAWELVDDLLPPKTTAWGGMTLSLDRSLHADSSPGWEYREGPEGSMDDETRLARSGDTTEYLLWEAEGLTGFSVVLYAADQTVEDHVVFEVAKTKDQWSVVPYTVTVLDQSEGWYALKLQGSVAEPGAMLRLTIKEGKFPGDALQLGKVTLSGIKK